MANEEKDIKKLDLYLLDKWKETGRKEYFQRLYRGFGGFLNKASGKAAIGSNIPRSVFKLEAAQQFHSALERFDPTKGASLQTFVFNTVQDKLKRINYKYQNLARRPERSVGGVYHINQFNNEKAVLRDKLDREPSARELADALSWSVKQVENMQLEDRKDLSLNAELEELNYFDDQSALEAGVAMNYYDMNPEEQLIFDHATGSHGKLSMLKANGRDADYKAIAKELNMPESKVQKIRKKLVGMEWNF